MGRAPCCDKANVKKGSWSPEEDAKLKSYIEKYGTGGNWITLPRRIGLKRCGKSCRLRWLNYLRPDIKHGGFSEEEDNIICNMYTTIGSRKFSVLWSTIATQLPGRTDNDIKNYWNTKLKKKILSKQRNEQNLARMISALKQEPVKKLAEDLKVNNPVYSPNLVRFGGMYLNDFLIHTDQEHVYECSNVSLSSINGGSSSVETAYNMDHFDINYNRFFVEFQDKINESAFFNSEHIVRDSDWSNPFEIMNYLVSPTQLYNQEAAQVEIVVEDAPIESIVAFPEL